MSEATAAITPATTTAGWTIIHYIAAATGAVLIVLGCVL
jgi:hypothetical protein